MRTPGPRATLWLRGDPRKVLKPPGEHAKSWGERAGHVKATNRRNTRAAPAQQWECHPALGALQRCL
eukprot:4308051-Lingulodinium_polyedra.AAC.1